MAEKPLMTILHMNDFYDLQPDAKEPKGGAAYFKAMLDRYKASHENVLTLFSGDAFAPSLLSSEYEGKCMIKPINSFGIDVACLGNHQFDYKLSHVLSLLKQTNFPWLLSNVYHKITKKRLADAGEYKVIECGALRVGIFSLAQPEWVDTLYPTYHDIVQVLPFIEVGKNLIDILKNKQKCDLIVALTHMMRYNDMKLAEALPEIDLILGGHDHLILHEQVNNSVMIKSGTNFKHFTCVEIFKRDTKLPEKPENPNLFHLKNNSWAFQTQLVEINHQAHKITPDPQLDQYIHSIYKQFSEKQSRVALYTRNQIDLLFKTIRKQQSPFLEYIAAFYRHYARADCVMLNGGCFRGDCIIPPGPITFGTLCNIIEEPIVVKIMPGHIIVKALENMVSMYPNLSGRMCALSGIQFTWDSRLPSFERVLKDTILINKIPIDLDKQYRMALHEFMSMGGDAFSFFKDCPKAVDHEHKMNTLLLHELLKTESPLVQTFMNKYPKRSSVIQVDGKKYVQVHVTHAKRVKMLS